MYNNETQQMNNYLNNITYNNFDTIDYIKKLIIPFLLSNHIKSDNFKKIFHVIPYKFTYEIKTYSNEYTFNKRLIISLTLKSNNESVNVTFIADIEPSFYLIHFLKSVYPNNYYVYDSNMKKYYTDEFYSLSEEYGKSLLLNKVNNDVYSVICSFINDITDLRTHKELEN